MANSKMSLVAQFDDLCRYSDVLKHGCEQEFKSFVMSQKQLFRKFKGLEAETEELKEKIEVLKKDKKKLETCMTQTKSLLAAEISRRKKMESEKASLERQIDLIKEVLMKRDGTTIDNDLRHFLLSSATCIPSASHSIMRPTEHSIESLLAPSDIDDTDDDLDVDSKRKRRSNGNKRSSGETKKRKSDGKPKDVVFVDFMDIDIPPVENLVKRRSFSEPQAKVIDLPPTEFRTMCRSESDQIKCNTVTARTQLPRSRSGTPVGRYSTGGKLSRVHNFATKTVIRQEKCYACGRQIKFCQKALKCGDCRVVCHPECKGQCPLPCVPMTRSTPTKGETGTLADYVSNTAPMIPPLVIHCVNEIKARGMKEMGLYRVSGSERHVKDLKEKLLKGNLMTLATCDIHAVCGALKEFLRSLKEPIITHKAWHTFVVAGDDKDVEMSLNRVYDTVLDLPQPNKETLAFLILHFQQVAETPECKMPLQSLAKVLGPTIVGYSSSIPTESNMLTETTQQCKVMERLLSISADLWEDILEVSDVCFTSPGFNSISRLGPIISDEQAPANIPLNVGRTSLTPRHKKTGKKPYLSPF